MLATRRSSRWVAASGLSFLLGVAIFSGLLYARVLTGLTELGAIVPIGGVALIVGWFLLAVSAWSARQEATGTRREYVSSNRAQRGR